MHGFDGPLISSFKYLARNRVDNFSEIFKKDDRATIAEVVIMETFFSRFVYKEDNESLLEAMAKKELLEVLQSFQRIRVMGQMDGLWNSLLEYMICWRMTY